MEENNVNCRTPVLMLTTTMLAKVKRRSNRQCCLRVLKQCLLPGSRTGHRLLAVEKVQKLRSLRRLTELLDKGSDDFGGYRCRELWSGSFRVIPYSDEPCKGAQRTHSIRFTALL